MSYILEALRKADAERKRGAVPDLHAQPLGASSAGPGPAPGPSRRWLWLLAGAAVPVAALLAWHFATPDAPPKAAVQAQAPAPLPVPVPQPESPPPLPAPPAPAAEPLTAPRPETMAAAPPARAPAAKVAEPRRPRPVPRAPVPTKKADAAQPPARADSLNDLPEDLRRQVPAMAIGGSVYSPQAESRMLIVNGQVVREGSALTPELTLEQIGRNSAVFSIRGRRFTVSL